MCLTCSVERRFGARRACRLKRMAEGVDFVPKTPIKDFYLTSPAICTFLGQAGSGKTRLACGIAGEWDRVFPQSSPLTNVVLVYGAVQDVYKEMFAKIKAKYPKAKLTTFNGAKHNVQDIVDPKLYDSRDNTLLILGMCGCVSDE